MAIAFDAASNGTGVSISPIQWNHTNAGNILFIGVAFSTTTGSVTSVTYGGKSAALITRVVGSSTSVEMWKVIDPPSGTNQVSVAFTGTAFGNGGAISFTGFVTVDGYSSATGSTSSLSASVTTSDTSCWVLDIAVEEESFSNGLTISGSGTQRVNVAVGSGLANMGMSTYGPTDPAGSTSLTWTNNNNTPTWSQAIVAITGLKKNVYLAGHRPAPFVPGRAR